LNSQVADRLETVTNSANDICPHGTVMMPPLLVTFETDAATRVVIEATIGSTARVVYLSDLKMERRAEALAQASVLLARHTAKELQAGEPELIHLCQLYVAKMKARKSGSILNIIGMGGRAVGPGYIAGAGGNAALIGFTNALGAETPDYNVRVFGINPAATMTDRTITLSKVRAKARFGDEARCEEALGADKLPFGRTKDGPGGGGALSDVSLPTRALPVRHGHRHGWWTAVARTLRRTIARRATTPMSSCMALRTARTPWVGSAGALHHSSRGPAVERFASYPCEACPGSARRSRRAKEGPKERGLKPPPGVRDGPVSNGVPGQDEEENLCQDCQRTS
jgi:NAD(P)-dependent dehydrogenase (short-subunit alcohol dehydrogenase family)